MFLFCNHGKIAPLFLSDAVMVPLYGAVVFSSASVRGTLRRIMSHSWLVELGEASYVIYIVHLPLLWWAKSIRSFVPSVIAENDFHFFLCYFFIMMAVCLVIFEFFEKPVRRWSSNFLTVRFLPAIENLNAPDQAHVSELSPSSLCVSGRVGNVHSDDLGGAN